MKLSITELVMLSDAISIALAVRANGFPIMTHLDEEKLRELRQKIDEDAQERYDAGEPGE